MPERLNEDVHAQSSLEGANSVGDISANEEAWVGAALASVADASPVSDQQVFPATMLILWISLFLATCPRARRVRGSPPDRLQPHPPAVRVIGGGAVDPSKRALTEFTPRQPG